MSIIRPCRSCSSGGGLRTQPRQSSCLAKTAEIKTRQGREWPQALPFACPHRALPLLPWALSPTPQLPRLLPPPTPCLGRVCHPQLFPTDHLSFLSIPSPLAASMPSASRTLLLLLSCPLRWFVNFLAPGIPCSRGCRGSTVCWARWAGAIQPLPGTGKKKPHKVRKDPTNHLSQQCTPVFVH